MNQFGATQFDGAVTLMLPASAATHPVRYGEFQAQLSGVTYLGHGHVLADLTDWETLGPYVKDALVDTSTLHFRLTGNFLSGVVQCKPGGGVIPTGQGLAVDLTGIAAALVHTHVLDDVTDFDAEHPARLHAILSGTPSIAWTLGADDLVSANVRRKSSGGLLEDANGLYVDLGTGATQAAAGNHTHAQLHDAVTLGGASATIEFSLAGQVLDGEVLLHPTGGLQVQLSGVGCDFGTGTNQVARGDHTHAQLHDALTVAHSPSLLLHLTDQHLSGAVPLDPAPAGGRGKLGVGAAGLYVQLGTAGDEAAAGNHGHTAATPADDGFMSALDKSKLDDLAERFLSGAAPLAETVRFTLDGYGQVLLSGVRDYYVLPYAATITGWEIVADTAPGAPSTVDVRRQTYAGFPPADGDTLAAADRPYLLSGSRINRNLNASTWTTGLLAGDVLEAKVMSALWVRRLVVQLFVTRVS